MRWLDSGRLDVFEYQRIAWPSFSFAGTIGGVEDATITMNGGSSLKVSGAMRICGGMDFKNDLVRIVSTSSIGDETEKIVHATLFATSPTEDHAVGNARAGVNLYSTLVVLEKKRVRSSLRIPAAPTWSSGAPSSCALSSSRARTRRRAYVSLQKGSMIATRPISPS